MLSVVSIPIQSVESFSEFCCETLSRRLGTAPFNEFPLQTHVPADHLLRSIDRFVELGELRRELAAFSQHDKVGLQSIPKL